MPEIIAFVALALFGGFIGYMFEVAGTKVASWYKLRKLRHVLPVPNFWFSDSISIRPSLQIIASGGDPKSKRSYTHSCEVEALYRLYGVLRALPLSIRTDYAETMAADSGNWILLGTGDHNPISKKVLQELKKRTDLKMVVPPNGSHSHFMYGDKCFGCSHTDDSTYESRVTADHGVILRRTFENGSAILLCGGVHMYGTQAALETAVNPAFVEKARKMRCNQFIQLVYVRVRGDGIGIDPTSIEWESLPFVCIK